MKPRPQRAKTLTQIVEKRLARKKGDVFLRADFERTSATTHLYQSYVQTLSEDYLLTIEIFASSPAELQQVAASLQSMSITEDEP